MWAGEAGDLHRRRPCQPPVFRRGVVAFYLGEQRQARRITRRLFARELLAWEYAGLGGALDDAQVDVGTLGGHLYLDVFDPAGCRYRAIRLVRSTGSGPVIVNDGFCVHRPSLRRQGLGVAVLRRQLACAASLGITRIETIAGRSATENGYYTWPRLGFDGCLPAAVREALPPRLQSTRCLLDLMASEEGRQWWRRHGSTVRVVFDMAPRGRSWKAFRRYLGGEG